MPRQNTAHTTFLFCWVLLSRPALILPARKPNGWYALSRNYAKNVQLVSHGRKWKKIVGAVGEGGCWRSDGTKKREVRGRETRKLTDLQFRPRAGARREQDGDIWQQETGALIACSCFPTPKDVSFQKCDRVSRLIAAKVKAATWWWWWW